MKLLIFAHVPPPYHGQSYMTELVLRGLGGDARLGAANEGEANDIECFHVDSRYSEDVQAIGKIGTRKLRLLFTYCLQAITLRYRFGVTNLFYIPAAPMRSAIYRDWLVMLFCRPFFSRRIYLWQAAGLHQWLKNAARPWERWITRTLLGAPDLSIVLGEFCREDAAAVNSRRTEVIPNAIPDPCPEFEREVLPRRLARVAVRGKLMRGESVTDREWELAGKDPKVFRLLFLSLCCREKGLFDTLDALAMLAERLQKRNSPVQVRLAVGGIFVSAAEERRFEARIAQPDLRPGGESLVEYHGFVSGESKRRLFLESDCFCFPSYYDAESFGIVMVEAMAFGLPVIAARWRSIPERFPKSYSGLVEPKSPEQIARVMESFIAESPKLNFRYEFLENYTESRYIEKLKSVLHRVNYKHS